MNPSTSESSIRELLTRCRDGECGAKGKLWQLLADDLRHRAVRALGAGAAGGTLHPTALVHEAWLRIEGGRQTSYEDRDHFLGAAATAMRHIVIDGARRKNSRIRAVTLDSDAIVPVFEASEIDLVKLDAALSELSELDADLGELVELRFFGGANVEETARMTGVAKRTVERRWTLAKAFLASRLS